MRVQHLVPCVPCTFFLVLFFGLFFSFPNAFTQEYPSRLTIPFVISRAQTSTASFRAIESDRLGVDAPKLRALEPYAPKLGFGLRYLKDQTEPTNPFSSSFNRTRQFFLGYEQGISLTGTKLNLEMLHGNTTLLFPTFTVQPYHETRLGFSVSQSLYQSLWLGLDRKRRNSGILGEQANELDLKLNEDQATLQLIELYYQAWLSQMEVRTGIEALKNKQTLLEITELKLNRGTAERPDLLQVKASQANAQNFLEESENRLSDTWRELVIQLKLPESLATLDPKLIPIDLDSNKNIKTALARCSMYQSTKGFLGAPFIKTLAAQKKAEEANANARSFEALSNPDLILSGKYLTNGVDTSGRSGTFNDISSLKHPLWSVELSAQIPLGISPGEGDSKLARTQALRSQIMAEFTQDKERVEKQNRCIELKQSETSYLRLKEIFENQKERQKLEEQRFRIGRSTLLQVIVAADEKVNADWALQKIEIGRRISAWKVLELEGNILKLALESLP